MDTYQVFNSDFKVKDKIESNIHKNKKIQVALKGVLDFFFNSTKSLLDKI